MCGGGCGLLSIDKHKYHTAIQRPKLRGVPDQQRVSWSHLTSPTDVGGADQSVDGLNAIPVFANMRAQDGIERGSSRNAIDHIREGMNVSKKQAIAGALLATALMASSAMAQFRLIALDSSRALSEMSATMVGAR